MAGIGLALILLVTTPGTTAGFQDRTYARAGLTTEGMPPVGPVGRDQSAGSTLYVTRAGDLYVSGMRNSGDGNGSGSIPAQADPTRVNFPAGVRIVDAGGSSNDFSFSASTSYMALDDAGGVWTWGSPYGGKSLIGRGNIGRTESLRAGQVTRTADGGRLPPIVGIDRSENQFLALDAEGTLWSWGYDGENLPRSSSSSDRQLPARSNTTTTTHGRGDCDGPGVRWHSVWGGNNASAAVATNGLIYSWGFDNDNGVANGRDNQRCPILNESANRALFEAYPDLYRTNSGAVYDEDARELTGSSPRRTEALRKERYEQIVRDMQGRTLEACADVARRSGPDEGPCPVRSFGYSARAPRLLLQNGDLYTWQISTEDDFGGPFLGRIPSANDPSSWWQDGSRFKPTVALRGVASVSPGVSSVTALTRSGEVYGWGRNNVCQAVGAETAGRGSCVGGAGNGDGVVVLPRRVAGLEGARIETLSATQCATWAFDAEGRVWAWGAGTATGATWRYCSVNGASWGYASTGYKIYDAVRATPSRPFGEPVTDAGTPTLRVR
ncbi:hypothetical protein NBM05_13390 [Rothia sp. AR01]|uniref:Chromosome condensation regulator RCC1 n=1 Tax=Rothia santali TaxID=2949643 RepID=A0A9X2HER3_9MICC|nr:hypothetical protein [Rothia santali]MCP3426975.1 hypothetical protein [Rothia santali]